MTWKTRFAPTPSGFLHLGNIYSFALTVAIARATGAKIFLRIDDLDGERTRDEFIDDIFQCLRFMNIPWDEGPRNKDQFLSGFSQKNRLDLYENALAKLADTGKVFACTCSRKQLSAYGRTGYPGTCREKGIPLKEKNACWRIRCDEHAMVAVNTLAGVDLRDLTPSMRDFIVRRRDGVPAYQLCSVIDDAFFQVNLVVRGEDLFPSTLAQLYIAEALKLENFKQTVFHHHKLLFSDSGSKLSKSAGDPSIMYLKGQGMSPESIYAKIGELSGEPQLRNWTDLEKSAYDLCDSFKNRRGK